MAYPRIREALESSSAAVLQAVAAALSNAWLQPPAVPNPLGEAGMQLAARLPRPLVNRLGARALHQAGLHPALANEIHSEGLARQALSVYDIVEPGVGYPAIIVGAPSGALAYLAALMRIPYLPAQFLLSFSHNSPPDDIRAYQAFGSALIETILDNNPDLHAVNHYDPIHDRFLVDQLNHVRLKLRTLPLAFQQFIYDHLTPGGTVFFAECTYTWDQYLIGPNHTFQVGGLGGYVSADYFEGNEELDAWLASMGANHRGGWMLSEHWPLEEQPESEWGSLPEFKEDVERFAQAQGYTFKVIKGGHPEDFSALAYTAYLWEMGMHEQSPQGVLIESFSQINPTAALRSRLLPLWLPFNTDDSLAFLARMTPYMPNDLPILLSLVPAVTRTPDMPDGSAWEEIAGKAGPVHWLGIDPARYPLDLGSRSHYLPALQDWVHQNPHPSPPRMSPDDFVEMTAFLQRHGANLLPMLLDALSHQQQPHPPQQDTEAVAAG